MEGVRISVEKKLRVNDEVQAPKVRLISEKGEQLGIYSSQEARRISEEAGLDLVEVSPDGDLPVCRIMNFGQHVFKEKKRRAAARKKQKLTQVKEIKFRPSTEIADYQVKLRNLLRFLNQGDKAKVTIRFRGREMAHPELGMELMERIIEDVAAVGVVEFAPKMEGRQMLMIIAPKKT